MDALPPEIIDAIVDSLDKTKANSLAPLLWVSPVFHYPVKCRLFRFIDITYYHNELTQPRCILLHSLLRGDREICQLVRGVTIRFDMDHKLHDADDLDMDNQVVHSMDLISMIYMLSKAPVTDLALKGIHEDEELSACYFGDVANEALLALRCNPHVRKFTIERLYEIPGLLISGLPFEDQTTTFETHMAQVVVRPLPYLSRQTQIAIERHPPFVSKVLHNLDSLPFSNLTTLILPYPDHFPWDVCLPLKYDPSRGIDYNDADAYSTVEPNFRFPRLETLVMGEWGRDIRRRGAYKGQLEWIEHQAISTIFTCAPRVHTLDLTDCFREGLHDSSDFPLCTILQKGTLQNLTVKTFVSTNPSNQIQSIATFFSNSNPFHGLTTLSLFFRWGFETVYGAGKALSSAAWEELRQILEKTTIMKFVVELQVYVCGLGDKRWADPKDIEGRKLLDNLASTLKKSLELRSAAHTELTVVVDDWRDGRFSLAELV